METQVVSGTRNPAGAPAGGWRGRADQTSWEQCGPEVGGRRHDPESTLPESPPGTDGGSVRVNTAATAANTATPPRRPPERRGPARAARPPAGPPPSPWRPMGQKGPRKEDTAGPRTRDSRVPPLRRASAARGDFRVGPGGRDRTFCAGAGGENAGSRWSQAQAAFWRAGLQNYNMLSTSASQATVFFVFFFFF